ncbi:hypothetical protein [Deinococcus sp.]|uniref:hypothetical protein n=1 Tax=Deinococcus sp. TaxID=47478 RepID=UPI0025CEA5E7|nr:hypothetical protein [Deinococcus sp.]
MDSRFIIIANLNQLVPGLLAFLGALGWFALRARGQPELRPNLWWGALAGLAALAVPSVMAQVGTYVGLSGARSSSRLPLMLTSLPSAVIWLLLSLSVLLICVFQRKDPLRRSVAAAVLAGVLVREVLLVVFSVLALLFFSSGLF